MNYCVVSKIGNGRPNQGRTMLVSFASRPLFKSYEEMKRQRDTISTYDKKTANYAQKKYAGTFEVVESSVIDKEFELYKSNPQPQL